jgi:hypothetical protein
MSCGSTWLCHSIFPVSASSLTIEFVYLSGPGRLVPHGNLSVPGHGAGLATLKYSAPCASNAGVCQRPPPELMSWCFSDQRSSGTVLNDQRFSPVAASSAQRIPTPLPA